MSEKYYIFDILDSENVCKVLSFFPKWQNTILLMNVTAIKGYIDGHRVCSDRWNMRMALLPKYLLSFYHFRYTEFPNMPFLNCLMAFQALTCT